MLQTWCREQGTCSAAGREPRWWTQGRPSPVDGTPSFLLLCVWIVVTPSPSPRDFHCSFIGHLPSFLLQSLPAPTRVLLDNCNWVPAFKCRRCCSAASLDDQQEASAQNNENWKKTTIPLSLESTAHFYNFCCTRRDIRKKLTLGRAVKEDFSRAVEEGLF